MNKIYDIKEKKPPIEKYILIRYSGGNWGCSYDFEGNLWRVGIILKDNIIKISSNDWDLERFDYWQELNKLGDYCNDGVN